MSIRASNNVFPHDPDDNFLEKGGYVGTAKDLDDSIKAIGLPDDFIKTTPPTKTGSLITINALDFKWRLDQIEYVNSNNYSTTIENATIGYNRIDIIVATKYSNFVKIQGIESIDTALEPPIPEGTLKAAFISVFGDTILDIISPIDGTIFVKKQESQDFIANYGATTVIDQINLIDDRSSISLIGSATDVKSVQLSGEFIRPGKPHFFKNRTGHDVKLWHLVGTGNIKYFFPNGLDLIVKPNEVIQFNTNANDSGDVRYEYVGGATAVDVSGKEDTSNKSNDIETDKASTSKYGNVAAWISWLKTYFFPNLTAKATPILTDNIMLGDSADSDKTKKSTLQSIRDLFKNHYDTIYQPLGSSDSPIYLGTLINDNFTRGSLGADYTIAGTASWSIVSNKLRVSGTGSSSNLTNNCFNTAKLTNSENFIAKMRFNFYQITATDYGLGFMLQSLGTFYKYSFYIALNLSTDANKGKLNVYSSTSSNGSSITSLNTTTRALALTIGDEIEYTIARNGTKYIFEARNNNTKDSVSYYLDSSLSAGYDATKIVNNVCKIGFSKQDAGSTAIYDITYFNVDRPLVKNRKFLFIGDSITFGYESGALNNRWADLVFSSNNLFNKHVVYSQPGNVSNDYNSNLTELAEFTSQYAVVMLGMNDAQYSVSLGSFQTNYGNLITSLVSQGKTPILCLIIPNSNTTFNASIVSYNDWIISNYSSTYLVIDTYHPLKIVTYTGPHPPLDGHKILAMTVYNAIRPLI